jgi:rod shape-determining protein MreC
VGRLRLRSDLALPVVCVGLYIAAAAQVRSPRGSALTIAVAAVSAPVLAVTDAVGDAWEAFLAGRSSLETTLEELGKLRREAAELHHTNQLLAAELLATRQGSRLLAAFPQLSEGTVLARVVARDAAITHSMRLDRGRADGVRLDAPVLAERGVLGRVDRVWEHGCRVQLLTHPAAAAAAKPVGLDVEGLVQGGDRPRMTGLPPYTKVAPDTPVMTTGSEGIYPAGLLLGSTMEARTEGLFTVVPLQLAAHPADVVVVLLLQPGGGGS